MLHFYVAAFFNFLSLLLTNFEYMVQHGFYMFLSFLVGGMINYFIRKIEVVEKRNTCGLCNILKAMKNILQYSTIFPSSLQNSYSLGTIRSNIYTQVELAIIQVDRSPVELIYILFNEMWLLSRYICYWLKCIIKGKYRKQNISIWMSGMGITIGRQQLKLHADSNSLRRGKCYSFSKN